MDLITSHPSEIFLEYLHPFSMYSKCQTYVSIQGSSCLHPAGTLTGFLDDSLVFPQHRPPQEKEGYSRTLECSPLHTKETPVPN